MFSPQLRDCEGPKWSKLTKVAMGGGFSRGHQTSDVSALYQNGEESAFRGFQGRHTSENPILGPDWGFVEEQYGQTSLMLALVWKATLCLVKLYNFYLYRS